VPSKKNRTKQIDGQSFVAAIPICIPRKFISVDFDEYDASIRDIRNALDEPEVINQNIRAVTDKLLCDLDDAMQNDNVGKIIVRRNVSEKLFQNVAENLTHAIQMRTGSSCCGITGKQRIILYYVNVPTHGMEMGSYYLCYFVELDEEEKRQQATLFRPKLPGTSGREIFRYSNVEDEFPVPPDNFSFSIRETPECMTNEDLMCQTLRECVKQSTNANANTVLTIPRCINSFGNCSGGMYIGLEVYRSMLFGGKIYNALYEEFGVMVKMEKKRGKMSMSASLDCPVGLMRISW
jgi:hypothetical protein